ncbi:methionine--tRNA ligase [Anaplasma phagocytophilum]|uniref:methionine--tRNA ligase n=1 Tax=Anaplasma phagocytophilum TaxID=948 RepID=UPI00200CF683|nr:methionine--tRNA ligase [Anaplasma phagocytophilum]UQD54449.1 methionine--tRNA ligase [Anaplasma phagocytophilum]
MSSKHFCVTTPIYYVNDVPHIGHFYTTLISDVLARFKRLDGDNVKFTTGTDEHGQKIEETARKRGTPVLQFVDEVSESFRELVHKSGFCADDFIRTTESRHKDAVVALWDRLYSRGQIYRGSYAGFYSVRDETFYQERDLIDGKAPTGAEVTWLEEPGYFFKLSEWQEALLQLYQDNPRFVAPEGKLSEVISFVKSGLRDLSVSRSKAHLSWGIGIPGDPEHLIYVWVDALSNYLALVGFPNEDAEDYNNFWCGENSHVVHVVGKDILKFHAVYWPALLMAAGLPLPKQVVAHGWWLNEGQKISKSLGNVICPLTIISEYGLDNVRYFLLSETPIGNDASFSTKRLKERVNCDLANNIGNLVQRTVTLVHKWCGGKVPYVDMKLMCGDEALPDYQGILEQYGVYVEECRFFEALKFIIGVSSTANEYIAVKAPWKLFKEDTALAEAVLFKLLEYIKCIGLMLQPFLPVTSKKLLEQIAVPVEKRKFEHIAELCTGRILPKAVPIFSKFDMDDV